MADNSRIIESSPPPTDPLSVISNDLRLRFARRVAEKNKLEKIADAQTDKAAEGDTKAAALVFKYALSSPQPQRVVNMQQAIIAGGHAAAANLPAVRLDIARLLIAGKRPRAVEDIASILSLPGSVIMAAMEGDPAWFQLKPDGWVATSQAREMVGRTALLENRKRSLTNIRMDLVHAISRHGPKTNLELAELAGTAPARLASALQHAWFAQEGGKWSITAVATAEVLEEVEG